MNIQFAEEYLGAIYRLRASPDAPLPLRQLQHYLNHTLISIHEMVRKLEQANLIHYAPYHGVVLTDQGEQLASSLIRRHRIWEVFLLEKLEIPWDETHVIAGKLEHAAPEKVTEQLSSYLGNPEFCPHGQLIPPFESASHKNTSRVKHRSRTVPGKPLTGIPTGVEHKVVSISPEIVSYMCQFQSIGIKPGSTIQVVYQTDSGFKVMVNGENCDIGTDQARTIWVN
jgi:Mn-dependent DtxR family transcriptional regulator